MLEHKFPDFLKIAIHTIQMFGREGEVWGYGSTGAWGHKNKTQNAFISHAPYLPRSHAPKAPASTPSNRS